MPMSTTPPRRPSTLAAAPVAAKVTIRPIVATTRAATAQQDGQIVTSVSVAFLLMVLVVASMSVRGSMRTSTSVAAVTGTLATVHARQSTFRLLNQRFATWRELEARGMRLPVDQAVVQSNASASHWFVSLRDSATGVICDKTGELFDEGPNDHRPICREPGR